MPRPAIVAQTVSRKPREEAVLFLNLGNLRPPAAFSAAIADSRPAADDGGADEVRAVLVVVVARAFAAATLGTGADANLVEPVGNGSGRDEPTTPALVAGEELVAVELEEPTPAKGVTRLRFGSGWMRVLR